MERTIEVLEGMKDNVVTMKAIEELYISGLLRDEGRDKAMSVEESQLKIGLRNLKMDIARILE